MRKIGFFLGYTHEQLAIYAKDIKKILTLLSSLMQENHDIAIVIAAHKWYENEVKALLQDPALKLFRSRVLTTPKKSLFAKLKDYFLSADVNLFTKKLSSKLTDYWKNLFSSHYLACALFVFLTRVIIFPFYILEAFLNKHLRMYERIKNHILSESQIEKNHRRAFMQLINLVNQQQDISLWFIPLITQVDTQPILAKKILFLSDSLLHDLKKDGTGTLDKFKKSTLGVEKIVCDDPYLKTVVESIFLDSPEIVSLKDETDFNQYLKINTSAPEYYKIAKRNKALQLVKNYHKTEFIYNHYLAGFDFASMRYIFCVTSSLSPKSNLFPLIKAYELLLRKYYVNIKLLTPMALDSELLLKEYVHTKRLQYDVLELPNASQEVIAAFHHLAICTINVILLQKEMPISFFQAYSVGTPSLLLSTSSEIALAGIQLPQEMLLDPSSPDKIAEKIQWAIKNKEALYEMQHAIFQELEQKVPGVPKEALLEWVQ